MKKTKNKRKNLPIYVAAVVVAFGLGFLTSKVFFSPQPQASHNTSTVKVWAVDNSVTIPAGLEQYLTTEHADDCKGWHGSGTGAGVALFAVESSDWDNYAQMAYGCSDNLTTGAMILAVKHDGNWHMVSYASGSQMPLCTDVATYAISKAAEPQCVGADGGIQPNPNP